MGLFDRMAEEIIQNSIRKGEFDNLEGKGKPLEFEDDSMVPPDLRMAYRILKNSGHVPPELQEEKEIHSMAELLSHCQDEQERCRQIQKLNYLTMKLNMRRNRPVNLEQDQVYYQKIVERVSVQSKSGNDKDGDGK